MDDIFEVKPVLREGEVLFDLRLDAQKYELLKHLSESGAWQLYRKLLINMKEGYFHATLTMDDPYKVMKNIGVVAGLNLAINQLVIINDQYKKQSARSVSGETKNHSPSDGLEG